MHTRSRVQLVNIDGNGNRVASLIHGPKNVIIIAGINKVVSDIPSAFKRARDIAAPANTVRLNKNTPCTHVGHCCDCSSPDCICNQFVITRRSGIPDRIKVILVGEELAIDAVNCKGGLPLITGQTAFIGYLIKNL